jgi:hypothetical protein
LTAKIRIRFPKLYPKQAEFIFAKARYTIVEAATKCGKTVACLVWLLWIALSSNTPGRNYWWVAPIFGQTKIAYRRLRRWLAIHKSFVTFNDSELTCNLWNGAIIWFKSADHPDALYGDDVHGAVIDEATRCKEEAWHAIRSTLTATKAPVKIIGNVKGRKNWAYKMARRAESGAPNMAYFKLTAYDAADAGIYDIAEIEDAKANLPEAVFNELYLCIPSDDQGNPFGIKAIEACIQPISSLPPVVWGVDLAKSVDWTVAIGLDQSGAVCRFERWQGDWEQTTRRLVSLIGQTRALVDSTGVGDPIVERLQKDCENAEGYKFTSRSKQQLMEGLAVSIQQESTHYPQGIIPQELSDFEYEYTRTGVRYSAPEGFFDDTVVALALAVRGLTTKIIVGRMAPTKILAVKTR